MGSWEPGVTPRLPVTLILLGPRLCPEGEALGGVIGSARACPQAAQEAVWQLPCTSSPGACACLQREVLGVGSPAGLLPPPCTGQCPRPPRSPSVGQDRADGPPAQPLRPLQGAKWQPVPRTGWRNRTWLSQAPSCSWLSPIARPVQGMLPAGQP